MLANETANMYQAQVLNQPSALVRMGDNQELYHSTLEAFLCESEELITLIARDVNDLEEGYERSIRGAHSLKGSAATIGAEQLRDAAQTLEGILKANDVLAYQVHVQHLEKQHQAVVLAIQGILKQSSTADLPQLSTSSASEHISIEQLIELLESSNMRAFSVYGEMLLHADAVMLAALEHIQDAMRTLDFKTAAKQLKKYIIGSN